LFRLVRIGESHLYDRVDEWFDVVDKRVLCRLVEVYMSHPPSVPHTLEDVFEKR
jgi:hypothetical protein